MTTKTKSFAMHPQLLWDVITKQAGTLGKALLEGVMNSIDAGATRIDLELTTTGFRLSDDGRGFGGEAEVDEFFATFGTPHTAGDARFGRFRMGRGQMFSFASTVWTSNGSQMEVDIKTKGLDFDYRIVEPTPGCVVVGKFYELLNARALMAASEEVVRNCLYVEIPLVINGEQVNKDPSKIKWSHATKEAFFNLRSGESRGIEVYQQGVFVETIPAHEFGMSGTIVTRTGHPLRVNFARNQVLRGCPLFQKILKAVGKESKKRVAARAAARTDLDDSEREMILSTMVKTGELENSLYTAKIFRDVTGRYWSARQIGARMRSEDMITLPDGRVAYSVAERGDRMGDRIMQENRGFVFDTECFVALGGGINGFFGCRWFSRLGGFIHLSPACGAFVPLSELAADRENSCVLLEDKQLTSRERILLKSFQEVSGYIRNAAEVALGVEHRYHTPGRTIRLGISQTAEGWTDGVSYIAIERSFLKRAGTEATGFARIAVLLLHEYVHQQDDTSTHIHTPEFYRAVHDASDRAMGFVDAAISVFRTLLRKEGKKLRHDALAEIKAREQAELTAAVLDKQPIAARAPA